MYYALRPQFVGTIEFTIENLTMEYFIFHGFQLILSYSADGGVFFTIEPGFYL